MLTLRTNIRPRPYAVKNFLAIRPYRCILHDMADKTERFELRLTKMEAAALRKLADRRGLNLTDLIAGYIRRAAKREKIW